MKRKLLFLALLLTAFAAWSCTEEAASAPDSVSMFSTEGTVEVTAGTRNVTIFTTCAWEASGDEWISIEPAGGDAKGIHEVKLTYGENTSGAPRTGTVTFKAGRYTQTYTLTQKEK